MLEVHACEMRDRDPQLRLLGGQPRVALNVLVPVQLHKAAKVEAARRGVSIASLVTTVLAQALHEDDRPPNAAA